MVKNPPAVQELWVRSLGQEDPLEKEMATHSSILAWKIPWTGSLAGYSPWGRKESNTTEHACLLHRSPGEARMSRAGWLQHHLASLPWLRSWLSPGGGGREQMRSHF